MKIRVWLFYRLIFSVIYFTQLADQSPLDRSSRCDTAVLPLKLYRHLSVFPQREAARADRSAKQVTMQLTGKVDNRGNACVVSSSFSLCLLLNKKKKKINPKTWKVTSSCAWGVYRWASKTGSRGGQHCGSCENVATGVCLNKPIACPLLKRQSVVIFLK